MRASHVLVKHRESRRPASWRCENITLTKPEAEARLKELEERIRSGTSSFEEVASTESDCGSARNAGDLGWFGPGEMMEPFEKATAKLSIGEMSSLVVTDSGFHLILRTG
mmetsp:Transcript_1133/g.2121  ORF Transcript_1133/g.2121 Transcript_1133/m.2121 type:complete len:110 (+) Transcript_1133:212-541(+)